MPTAPHFGHGSGRKMLMHFSAYIPAVQWTKECIKCTNEQAILGGASPGTFPCTYSVTFGYVHRLLGAYPGAEEDCQMEPSR